MAKGSFILHGSRKSVGNIVTYKRDGVQVIREKATSVSNPKTAGQANQRALFAPAAKFFSPLSVMLEKSFEGLNKSKSYSRFLQQAIKDAKNNGWYLPKDTGFFPLPYMITDGTIRSMSYVIDAVEGLCFNFGTDITVAPTTIGDLSQLFMTNGYLVGDQVTIFLVGQEDEMGQCYPVYVRFLLAPESTELLSELSPALSFGINDEQIAVRFTNEPSYIRPYAAGAIIVSRYQNKVWRRSTQRVAVNSDIMEKITSLAWKESSIESYMEGGSGTVFSDVYLNGSTINNEGGDTSIVMQVQLDNGQAFTPTRLEYNPDYAEVTGRIGDGNAALTVPVKLGADWLLTSSTKGALPEGTTPTRYVDGTQPAMKAWLMSQGVAQSVF